MVRVIKATRRAALLLGLVASCALAMSIDPPDASAGYCQVKTVVQSHSVGATCYKGAAWLKIVATCRREIDDRYGFTRSTIWFWSFNNARWGSVTCGQRYYVSTYKVQRR